MKFCLYYAWREMFRRPMRFVSLGCVIGITAVILPMIYGILIVFSGNYAHALIQYGVLAVLIGLLIAIEIYALCSEQYRQTAPEYEILEMYGVAPKQKQMIHTIQILILCTAAIFPALGISWLWLNTYAKKTEALLTGLEKELLRQCPQWLTESFHFPQITGINSMPVGFLLCGFSVFLISLTASRLAEHRQHRTNAMDIKFLMRNIADQPISNMSVYRRITFFRMRSSVRRLRITAVIILFLPIFLFGVSALFSDITPTSDMSISLADTKHREIDASVIEAVNAVSGVQSCRLFSEGNTVHVLSLTLDDKTWVETVGKIAALPEINTYNVMVSRVSITVSNICSASIRSQFSQLSVLALISACIGIRFLISDWFRARKEEFSVLSAYGMSSFAVIKADSVFRLLLPSCLATGILGVGLLAAMHISGGAGIGHWMASVMTVSSCMSLFMPILFAVGAAFLIHDEKYTEGI